MSNEQQKFYPKPNRDLVINCLVFAESGELASADDFKDNVEGIRTMLRNLGVDPVGVMIDSVHKWVSEKTAEEIMEGEDWAVVEDLVTTISKKVGERIDSHQNQIVINTLDSMLADVPVMEPRVTALIGEVIKTETDPTLLGQYLSRLLPHMTLEGMYGVAGEFFTDNRSLRRTYGDKVLSWVGDKVKGMGELNDAQAQGFSDLMGLVLKEHDHVENNVSGKKPSLMYQHLVSFVRRNCDMKVVVPQNVPKLMEEFPTREIKLKELLPSGMTKALMLY